MTNEKCNDLPKDLSPMCSTAVESNDSHLSISNDFKDGKSSSKITFAFDQLDFLRLRVSHIIESLEFNDK